MRGLPAELRAVWCVNFAAHHLVPPCREGAIIQERLGFQMTEHDPDNLTEEEAAQLWERAAQLQAEAAGRVSAPEVDGAGTPPPGYALAHVRAAALEAGIGPEFVEIALVDLRAKRTLVKVEGSHALSRRFLNDPPEIITVRRTVEATPQDVFSAMQAVFPDDPFRLTVTDQQGDPLDGGVLVFDIPGLSNPFQRGFAFEVGEAGLRQLLVTLRPIEGPTPSCEVTVHSPVTSHNLAFGLGALMSTLAGGAGSAALGVLGVVIGIGPVGAVAGALLGVGVGVKGFRALYGLGMRRARRAIEGLVGAVAVRATGLWTGTALPPRSIPVWSPPPPPPPSS